METTAPTLNPFAVSYVPLAKRVVDDVVKECKTVPREADVSDDAYAAVEDLKLKAHQGATEFSQEMDDSIIMDDDSEIDLAYLQMIFPGVSDQSVADVYNVNMGDLEAALDMLSDLETALDQADGLNIENAVEPVSASGECSSSVKAVATS
ncbi:hypothetical protein vseg_021251 [Gypsophila vaccaria]